MRRHRGVGMRGRGRRLADLAVDPKAGQRQPPRAQPPLLPAARTSGRPAAPAPGRSTAGSATGSASRSSARGGGSARRGGQRLGLAPERAVERVERIVGLAKPPRQAPPRHPGQRADGLEAKPLERPRRLRRQGAARRRGGGRARAAKSLSPRGRGLRGERARNRASAHAAPGGRRDRRPAPSARAPRTAPRTSATSPASPPNRCATPLTSSRSPSPPSTSTSGDQRAAQRASRSTSAASPAGSAGTATSAGSSARASVSRAPARAPRRRRRLGHRVDHRPVRAPRWSARPARQADSRRSPLSAPALDRQARPPDGRIRCSARHAATLQRPGGAPRARNSSASHAGAPGARGSNGWARLRRARHPPAHPRPAQIGAARQAAPASRHARPLGRDRQPPRGGEVERSPGRPTVRRSRRPARRILSPPPSPTAPIGRRARRHG